MKSVNIKIETLPAVGSSALGLLCMRVPGSPKGNAPLFYGHDCAVRAAMILKESSPERRQNKGARKIDRVKKILAGPSGLVDHDPLHQRERAASPASTRTTDTAIVRLRFRCPLD